MAGPGRPARPVSGAEFAVLYRSTEVSDRLQTFAELMRGLPRAEKGPIVGLGTVLAARPEENVTFAVRRPSVGTQSAVGLEKRSPGALAG